MQSLFSLDSPIMRAMSRLADLVGLNLLFLLTSIPIFTIGPGLAAMYTVVFRMGTSRLYCLHLLSCLWRSPCSLCFLWILPLCEP